MSNPEHEQDRPREDPDFGLSSENADERSRAGNRPSGKESRYPVIRKPVPVSESGALRAPNSQGKSATQSNEPDPAAAGDDFGFLDDIDLSPTGSSRNSDFDDDWERPVGYGDETPTRWWRRIALFISVCALVSGGVLFSLPWLKQQGFAPEMPDQLPFGLSLNLPFDIPGFGKDSSDKTEGEVVATIPAGTESSATDPEQALNDPESGSVADSGTAAGTDSEAAPSQPQGPTLGSRFRDALNEVETLVANEQFDEAGLAIAALDRSVYGYGAAEFKALQARVDEVQGASKAAAAAAAEQEARAREEAEAARARVEAEAAARQAEVARAERARVLAAQRQQTEERQREQAVQAAEAERVARVNQAADERQRALAEQTTSDRQATDRAVAEQRAANERRAAAQLQQEQTVATAPEQRSAAPVNRQITDADLQLVYGRFSDLAIAIETGNINDVISYTSRSTGRIQQFLQIFENSEFVSARITNVATRNARGSVTGTLSISGITRANGSTVDPPANLRSITLTSTREGNGWSLIDW